MRYPTAHLQRVCCALAAVGIAVLSGCSADREPTRSNILLITIDTLRADHLSSYGYPRVTSPVLDRLAAEGVRFDQAAVQWPKTGPSFASMFTATYPKNNGIVRKVGIPLPEDFNLLAEVLQAEGYQTLAVVSNGAVGKAFHFDQGFDRYVESWNEAPPEPGVDTTGAIAVTVLANGLLDEISSDRPFFLWVHYLDPHFPYTPPGEFRDLFQDDEHFEPNREMRVDSERAKRDTFGIGYGQVLDGRNDLSFYVARYDAEIVHADAEIGEFLATARERELLENTLTIVTSDHGESLAEHEYYFDHGRYGFQTCLRVPLIFHYPGVLEPAVDTDPAELIGLAPTLLEFAGVELDRGRWMQGTSLGRRLRGTRLVPNRPAYAFSEAGYGRRDMWQRIVRNRRYKFADSREGNAQRHMSGALGQRYALYDLERDPGENRNLAQEMPEMAEELLALLTRWYEMPFDAITGSSGDVGEMDEATREQLKALGYLD
ncbi:MAG: sulfatase [Thermoanaerobaculia bacterium]